MEGRRCDDGGWRAAGPPSPRMQLPPGFRFRPTDEELLTHYLAPKAADAGFAAPAAVREVDIYKAEPWDLLPPAGAGGGEDEDADADGGRYFFCRRCVKFPSGLRTNRATRAGYWKSTGRDRVVLSRARGGGGGRPVGVRKTLVFYRGRAPRGDKTRWVMHEYRLLNHGHGDAAASSSAPPPPVLAATGAHQSEWVICRLFTRKAVGVGETTTSHLLQQETQVTAIALHARPDDRTREPPPAIYGCGGKTTAPASSAAASDPEHANCFSNNIDLGAVAPGHNGMMDQSMLQLLKLNHHGREESSLMSYSGPSGYASSAQAALLRDEHELPAAADSLDILPQLLDYKAFLPFIHDF